jgi:hypothetical protein
MIKQFKFPSSSTCEGVLFIIINIFIIACNIKHKKMNKMKKIFKHDIKKGTKVRLDDITMYVR